MNHALIFERINKNIEEIYVFCMHDNKEFFKEASEPLIHMMYLTWNVVGHS